MVLAHLGQLHGRNRVLSRRCDPICDKERPRRVAICTDGDVVELELDCLSLLFALEFELEDELADVGSSLEPAAQSSCSSRSSKHQDGVPGLTSKVVTCLSSTQHATPDVVLESAMSNVKVLVCSIHSVHAARGCGSQLLGRPVRKVLGGPRHRFRVVVVS